MIYEKPKTPQERLEAILGKLEEKDEFMRQAGLIAELMKDLGTMPTPRQMKVRLDLDARKMRKACGEYGHDPYDLLVKEAKRILQKEGLTLGFGRVELIPETKDDTSE